MTEGITHPAITVAPEHVGRRQRRGGSRIDRASKGRVDIPNSDLKGARRARQGLGRSEQRALHSFATLRRLADRRIALGALCTGGYALARAGLLDNCRATIHWENLSALREEFPRVRISDQLFTIDRDRFTCSGGTAPLDLMLNLIETRLGPRISQLVSEQFVVDRVRKDTDRQYIPLRAQIGVSHRGLIRVAQLMEENIEKPLSLEKIARATGLSRRQIERLFKRDLNCVPKRYYLEMRLKRARELLLQTAMPIMDITAACGFQSPPHFSKCYRNQFGHPPSAERKIRPN